MSKQGSYIKIEEDVVAGPQAPKIVHLRNVAYTLYVPSSSTGSNQRAVLSRAEVLESLMPLSRAPWSNVTTLIDPDSGKKCKQVSRDVSRTESK
ncbi:hypothetical protein BGZ58_007829 [Dissophora ornata]|nr:hypothetical protein BGZ58_007829 [Dissophora ornata]